MKSSVRASIQCRTSISSAGILHSAAFAEYAAGRSAKAKQDVNKFEAQLKSDQQRIERDKMSHARQDKADLRQAMADYNKAKAQLAQAQAQLSKWTKQKEETEAAYGYWRQHPYNGGLTELRQCILSLEQAAIHYAQQWISLAQSSAGATGSTNSTGGTGTSGTSTAGNGTSTNTT